MNQNTTNTKNGKNTIDFDELHEECGVFGMYDFDGGDVASTIYYGLFALQHRGQESCGIAVSETQGYIIQGDGTCKRGIYTGYTRINEG